MMDSRPPSAMFKRAEQLKRWQESDTNKQSPVPKHAARIQFSTGTVFLAACKAGDKEEIQRLLNMGADINTPNVDGLTALHQACIDDNMDMVEFLVSHGADVNRRDNEGWTPLHATASCGFDSIARFLIEKGADIAAVNYDGELPIDITEIPESMKKILKKALVDQGIDCEKCRKAESTALLKDARLWALSGYQEIRDPKTGGTPLHVAAAKGYIDVAKTLLGKCNIDPNCVDYEGWTPLHAAALWGQKEVAALLLKYGADHTLKNFSGQTCVDVVDPNISEWLQEAVTRRWIMRINRSNLSRARSNSFSRIPSTIAQQTNTQAQSATTDHVKPSNGKNGSTLRRTQSFQHLSTKQKETTTSTRPVTSSSYIAIGAQRPHETKESTSVSVPTTPFKKPLDPKDHKTSSAVASTSSSISGLWKPLDPKAHKTSSAVASTSSSIGGLWKPLDPKAQKTSSTVASTNSSSGGLWKPREPKASTSTSTSQTSRPAAVGSRLPKQDMLVTTRRTFVPPTRDDESETQRKAHAKRVRETRRSTQGVTLDTIKSAEQLVKNKNSTSATSASGTRKAEKEPEGAEASTSAEAPQTATEPSVVRGSDEEEQQNDTEKLWDFDHGANTVPSPATQAAINVIQRRRRSKRRSTGVGEVGNDAPGNGDPGASGDRTVQKEYDEDQVLQKQHEENQINASCSVPSKSEPFVDYKALYESAKLELRELGEKLEKCQRIVEQQDLALSKLHQNVGLLSGREKRQKRALDRKLSEMEEELKQLQKLKAENERLRAENRALTRVVSKLTNSAK